MIEVDDLGDVALLRASQGTLRARVVLAIAVTVLATGGVWAYGYTW